MSEYYKHRIRKLVQFKEDEWKEILKEDSIDVGDLIKEVFNDIEEEKKLKPNFFCDQVCISPCEYEIGIEGLRDGDRRILMMIYDIDENLIMKIFELVKKTIDLEDYD